MIMAAYKIYHYYRSLHSISHGPDGFVIWLSIVPAFGFIRINHFFGIVIGEMSYEAFGEDAFLEYFSLNKWVLVCFFISIPIIFFGLTGVCLFGIIEDSFWEHHT